MDQSSLYQLSMAKVATHFDSLSHWLINHLPTDVLFDVYYEVGRPNYKHRSHLANAIADVDLLDRFLVEVKSKRNQLHQVFQAVIDSGLKIDEIVATLFVESCKRTNCSPGGQRKLCATGINLATFLMEAGWYNVSRIILEQALSLYPFEKAQDQDLVMYFECHWKLLSVYNMNCQFAEASETMDTMLKLIAEHSMESAEDRFNLSQAFMEFAHFYFLQSRYDQSYEWVIQSLRTLHQNVSTLTLIDVLRQAAKTCIVKRKFKKAEMLIKQTVIICKKTFNLSGDSVCDEQTILHPKLAEVFLDYGFYLLNIDLISISIKFYETALRVRERIFSQDQGSGKCNNLLLAIAYEEYAYAMYVFQYSNGRFNSALNHSDAAMKIMTKILPNDHLLMASAKRVKALILEEIAIDHHEKSMQERMLIQSQELHLSALEMAQRAFGDHNVQTAKHYGNLGRLYQSMKKYDEAEAMHLKAISIKEQLLGPDDYEVALSIGHLASLYSYDMGLFEKAEQLYLRSIRIGVKLFGEGYSGLEYDYRGLMRVYSCLRNYEKLGEYSTQLFNWQQLRDSITGQVKDLYVIKNLNVKRLKPVNILYVFENLS